MLPASHGMANARSAWRGEESAQRPKDVLHSGLALIKNGQLLDGLAALCKGTSTRAARGRWWLTSKPAVAAKSLLRSQQLNPGHALEEDEALRLVEALQGGLNAMNANAYHALGLERNASNKDIRRAFRTLSKKYARFLQRG